MKYKAHPYADLLPMMSQEELAGLAADIAENGLQQPVVLYKGQVLDGRNRLLACEQAEVEPAFTEYQGEEPLAFVLSLNLHRRDLTPGQRAAFAAKASGPFTAEAKKRQEEGGKEGGRGNKKPSALNGRKVLETREELARVFKVGKNLVQQALTLQENEPDLLDRVHEGSQTLGDAWADYQHRVRLEDERRRNAKLAAEYDRAIKEGEMTLEQAIEAIQAKAREEEEDRKRIARARREWLEEFVQHVEWLEQNLCGEPDEQLAWYTEPDSPGLYEHGMTAERIGILIDDLRRAQSLTFGASNASATQPGKKARKGPRP